MITMLIFIGDNYVFSLFFCSMAKQIVLRHELMQTFKEAFTGIVTDCGQFTCQK